MQHLEHGMVLFPHTTINSGELHKARGYFSDLLSSEELLHNHIQESTKLHYRYPAIQFKRFKEAENKLGVLSIHAFNKDAIKILQKIFLLDNTISGCKEKELIKTNRITKELQDVFCKEFKVDKVLLGDTEDNEAIQYQFISPWIGLNPKNYKDYQKLDNDDTRTAKLNSIIVQNIISFCKFSGYTIKNRLLVTSNLRSVKVNLKGKAQIGFLGSFKVNFLLPDYLGLGKSSSRGYGNIIQKRKKR